MVKNRVSTLVSAILVLGGLTLGVFQGPAHAMPPPGPGVPLWAPDWMADSSASLDPGLPRALKEASTFDLIVAHPGEFNHYVPQMMKTNPNLRLFVYVNGLYSSDSTYPEGMYAHTAKGRRIKSVAFGTYLMDPTSIAWRRDVRDSCVQGRAQSGYQGCFLDSLGLSGINPASITGQPIDPRTGINYRRKAWLNDTEGLAQFVRLSVSPNPVFGNGLVDGSDYFASTGPTSRLLDGLTAGMDEAWVRQATDSVKRYRTVTAWRKDVDMLIDIAARPSGNIAIVICKVWVRATPAQVASWHKYALGTFMLGYKPGHAYFSFRADHKLTDPYSMTSVNIGSPLGAYFANGPAFQRRFSAGTVVVNPTGAGATVALGGAYVTSSGKVVRSISVGPHSAAILTKR